MNSPGSTYRRFARLRGRIQFAERMAMGGMGLMVLASLLRTAQAVPTTRGELFTEWAVCAATVFGWALLCVGMRLTTQAIFMHLNREAWTRKLKANKSGRPTQRLRRSASPAPTPTQAASADDAILHRAVWAMAKSNLR